MSISYTQPKEAVDCLPPHTVNMVNQWDVLIRQQAALGYASTASAAFLEALSLLKPTS